MSKFSGYADTGGVELDSLELFGHWVLVREAWERPDAPEGIVLLKQGNTVLGEVLAVGYDVDEEIAVGDRILFEAWQGGRWSFRSGGEDLPALLMDEQYVLARLEDAASSIA